MRLALKNTLILLVGYGSVLLLLGGVAVFQVLALQANDQKETARLFAREVAGALTEPSLQRLLQADRNTRQNLRTLIEQLTAHSQVVTSISVIDSSGRVVASDNPRVGARPRTPEQFFGNSRRMRFTTFGAFPFYNGSCQLAVPLIEHDRLVGTLLIDLRSRSVGEMNRRMWNGLLSAALLGLLCITGLGFALHFQLSRRGQTLARTLEAAFRGESPHGHSEDDDEFAQAIATAGLAGREYSRARSRSAEERSRFITLGQVLNVGVVLIAADGQLDFASQRARELFACSSDEEMAAMLTRIRPRLEKGLRHSAAGREGVRIDLDPPGRSASLRLEVYPLEQGEGGGRLVLVRDRATMKAFETNLRLASQLRGLARLYLSVAHDIRAPLSAIVVHLELLRSSLKAEGPSTPGSQQDRREGYLNVLDQEITRLRRSLDSMLDHATLPRDELEELDARDLVADLKGLIQPQCDRQKVQLTADVPEQPVRMVGVRDALKQALLNISINALEAMPAGGRLALRLEAEDSHAVISISDSGPGIPGDLAARIFDMHFTTKPGGSGIGLHVARAVVESSGGEIQLSSETGRGTTFRIDLPAQPREGG